MAHQQNRTVLITGGTAGIGLHSAIGIGKTGARVLIAGRNCQRGEAAVRQIQDATDNRHIIFVEGDLSSVAGIDRLTADVQVRAGKLDVLVNNAGYLGDEMNYSDDGLEMHFAVNVLAPWRLSRALMPALKAAPSARILNITGVISPPLSIPIIFKLKKALEVS